MTNDELILLARRNIDNALIELQHDINTYSRNVNTITENLNRIQNLSRGSIIGSIDKSTFQLLALLVESNGRIKAINDRILRNIDRLASLIAGYLCVMLDECISNYTPVVKVGARTRLQRLQEMREISVDGHSEKLQFPSAVAVLTPYIIKTRMARSSENLVSVRNVLRAICDAR